MSVNGKRPNAGGDVEVTIPEVVHPSAEGEGKAADAKATYEALKKLAEADIFDPDNYYDKDAVDNLLDDKQNELTFDDAPTTESNNPVKSGGIWSAIWGALSALPAGFTSLYDWCVAQLNGKADRAANPTAGNLAALDANGNPVDAGCKAGDLARYSLTTKTIVNNAVTLDDRACNYVDAKEISDYLAVTFPSYVTDKIRDFILILECSAYTPTISYESVITLEGEEDVDLTPEEGVNVYFFTEFDTGRFAVARKLITKLVDNIPVTGAQLLRVVEKQGTGVTANSFGDIMSSLGLTETNNLADAVNAVMKG